ncbi:MAG: hypothetical protein ACO1OB_03330 [Archangium sp.]
MRRLAWLLLFAACSPTERVERAEAECTADWQCDAHSICYCGDPTRCVISEGVSIIGREPIRGCQFVHPRVLEHRRKPLA